MRKLAYILLALVLAGCEMCYDSCPMDPSPSPVDPGNPDGGEGGDVPGSPGGPTQPTKRRPITPSGKILRPRFTIRHDFNILACRSSVAEPMMVTIACPSTGYEDSVVLESKDNVLEVAVEQLRGMVVITTTVGSLVEVEYFEIGE